MLDILFNRIAWSLRIAFAISSEPRRTIDKSNSRADRPIPEATVKWALVPSATRRRTKELVKGGMSYGRL